MPRAPKRARVLAALFGVLTAGLTAAAADVVIMADGLVLQGRWFKESNVISDPGTGAVRVDKLGGFDIIDEGPKFTIFSRHAQKGGKLEQGATRPEYAVYKTQPGPARARAVPPHEKIEVVKDFNEKWQRRLKFTIPPNKIAPGGSYEFIEQQVALLDPHHLMIVSTTNLWHAGYHTAEEDPRVILKLLRMHPELRDEKGKVDPMRRLRIAEFFKDIAATINLRRAQDDWLVIARKELEQLKKDAPGQWDKDATDRFASLAEEIDRVETRIVIDTVEAAVASGRYEAARAFLAGFQPKAIDPKEAVRIANLRANIETAQPRYELTARLLRDLIDRESGMRQAELIGSAAGGPSLQFVPKPKLSKETETLLTAVQAVHDELHADTVPRLELFRVLADQADQRRRAGKDPGEKPTELLAYAVTGWLKGKNAAEKSVPAALKAWSTRQMALGYLRAETGNERKAHLDGYLQTGKPLGPEELAQLITFLPPPLAEDPKKPGGQKVPLADTGGVDGVYKRTTGPLPGLPAGVTYYHRLPPEYHHGRAYPLVVALANQQFPAERLVGFLAPFAERYGYAVVAPEWTNQFNAKPYDFSGDDHPIVTATLRDVQRRFQVDADKVFLYGLGDGANFAIDVGMAHPDLFAGVIANGPNTPPAIFREYWRNAQKLPVYAVMGELTGAFPNLRPLFERWVTHGFPAMLTVYKGRGLEKFPLELPRMFDWMGRKSRVRGAGVLRLNQPGFEPWQVLRETDDRFYWVGVAPNGLVGGNKVKGWETNRPVNPARFRADIRNGVIHLDMVIGVKKFVIWLERDLIDWSKPIRVYVNNAPALKYKPQKLEPDLHLMFEELYRTGDRKMLYLGKLEIDGPG